MSALKLVLMGEDSIRASIATTAIKLLFAGLVFTGDGSVGPVRTALSIATTSRKKNVKNFLILHMSVMGAKTVRNAP